MNEQNVNKNRADGPAKDSNPDPITGTPGAHPIGTGLGAAGAGAAAGALAGAIAGPVGAVIGAAAGAVAGGIVGKAAAEVVNPTLEIKYWRENHASRPYADSTLGFDDYAPAYRYGWESYGKRGDPNKTFDAVESELSQGWDTARGSSRLGWDKAKQATRDAWDRVESGRAASPRGPEV